MNRPGLPAPPSNNLIPVSSSAATLLASSPDPADAEEKVEVVDDSPSASASAPAPALELSDLSEPLDQAIQVSANPLLSEMSIGQPNEDELLFLQLGDHVLIQSSKYNGPTQGIVYYRSLERIRVKPHGVSNLLHTFDVTQTDDEEIYEEADGVSAIYIIEKRRHESFVEQQDFRVQQVVDAMDEDGKSEGTYYVTGVDKDADSITIRPFDQPDAEERRIVFGFVGIPPEEGIQLFTFRAFVGPENTEEPDNAPSSYENENENENENGEPFNEEQDKLNRLEMLGTVEIVMPVVFRQAASYEQRIPDHIQKVDALNDFIQSLDPSLQKDPLALRHVRILVETLYHLNKETIAYNEEGEVAGTKPASVTTLSDLITKAPVPMGRAILQISKKLYSLPGEEEEEEKGGEEEGKDQVYLRPFESELRQMVDGQRPIVSSVMNGPAGSKTVIREWLEQQLFVKQYRPWTSDTTLVPLWSAVTDVEFFRSAPPETDEPYEEGGIYELQPTVRGYLASHSKEDAPVLDNIPFGMTRALGPTYRKGSERRKQLLLQPEEAPLEGYLLFPQKAVSSLGVKRSYDVAMDSGRSHLPLKTMRQLLEELGEPLDKNTTSRNILLVKTVGGELGTIPLTSYLSGLSFPALGWADTLSTLVHYGLDHYELYPELYRMLGKKISLAQDQVISALATLREALPAAGEKEEKENGREANLLPETTLWDVLSTQKILEDALEEYQQRHPKLATSDIGRTLYFMKYHDNFFQVTVGRNPFLIAKAVMEAYNQQYVDALRIQSRIRQLEREAGQRPKKNKCSHVADMVSVRRLTDDTERFYELTKVFKRYQGERQGNWFHCNICKEQLLCIHERLQLQAYLHPREKDVIEKEIILQCSGGQFQGKYICRNCGQGIRDLDFENTMEFDDEGRPLSGRAVLEDEDALLEERMEDLFKTDVETSDPVRWRMSLEEKRCHDVLRVLAERMGIFPDQDAYMRMIQRTLQHLNQLPSRARYAQLKTLSRDKTDYEVYHARHVVAFCSIFLLIEIQSKKPSYVIRFHLQGCGSTSFDGYPLDMDPAKEADMLYLSCAVSTIRLKEWPWKDTLYQQEPNVERRMGAIMKYMRFLLQKVMENATIQAELAEKRRYLIETIGRSVAGTDDIPRDMVFPTFLPDLISVSPEEAAKEAIVPEIAEKMGTKGQKALVRLWIRRAHQFATENLATMRGSSPFLETTCCVSPLSTPHAIWETLENMPPLPLRRWIPNVQGSALVTHFIPRPQDLAVAEADKELFYRVFLKYCFQGPAEHIGHPHELNLTHRCIWCGLQFPTHPSIMDTEKDGRLALQDQQVATDTDAFTRLLDSIHTVHQVIPTPLPHRSLFQEVMNDFAGMDPSPCPEWEETMKQTMVAFLQLNANALQREESKGDILVALGPLSNLADQYESQLRQRFDDRMMALMKEITQLSWSGFFQVIQTYFITMFYRVQSGYAPTSLFLPVEFRSTLSDEHVKDLEKVMTSHHAGWNRVTSSSWNENPQMDVAKVKMEYYATQMAEILSFRDKVRGLTLPGRQLTLRYIQQVLFYGPLAMLFSTESIPQNVPLRSAIQELGNPSLTFLLSLVQTTLERYRHERLSYDDAKIKTMLAVQAEKERIHIVQMFDTMSEEERAVEKMNKKYGLGRWAVGGSKVIYSYDKDHYDWEKSQRLAEGRGEFEEGMFGSQGEMLEPEGRGFDEMGLPVMNQQERGEAGGYNHAQHGDDD